jgi:hypothetical protein
VALESVDLRTPCGPLMLTVGSEEIVLKHDKLERLDDKYLVTYIKMFSRASSG